MWLRNTQEELNKIKVYGDGQQTRSFLYIEECVEGIRRLMESDCKEPLNLGSDEVISINDFAQMIIDISEKDVSIENIDVPQLGVRGRNSDNTLIKEKLEDNSTYFLNKEAFLDMIAKLGSKKK